MKSKAAAFAVSFLLSASTVFAQPMAVGRAPQSMLRTGTEVSLRTLEELTTNGKLLKVGRRFNLETTDPISVEGQVVIPAGSRAVERSPKMPAFAASSARESMSEPTISIW